MSDISTLEADRQRLINQARDTQRAGMDSGMLEVRDGKVFATEGHPANGHKTKLQQLSSAIRATEAALETARTEQETANRIAYAKQQGSDPRNTSEGSIYTQEQPSRRRQALPDPNGSRRDLQAAIDRGVKEGRLANTAGILDALADGADNDPTGIIAERFAATEDPAYDEFLFHARSPQGIFAMSAEAAEAGRRAIRAHRAYESLGSGSFMASGPLTTGSGDLPLAITVDQNVALTSSSQVDPFSTDVQNIEITTATYRAATSASMTFAFAAEGDEVADDTPSLDLKTWTPQRYHGFAEISWEGSQDWSAWTANLTNMAADARDALLSTAIVGGTAMDASQGFEGLVGTSGTAFVITTASTALAVADLISTVDALEPRYENQRTAWYANQSSIAKLRQLVPNASTTAANIFSDTNTMLGWPIKQASRLQSYGAGNPFLILGDMQQSYRRVTRLGMSLSFVPHVFGDSQRPTGVSGAYFFGRATGGIVNNAAFRIVKVHA